MGQYDVALPLYEDCLARTTQALGEDHPNTQITLKLHKQCAKKVAHFARVESAMHFVDMSSAPLELLLKAKKHVLESVEGCNERM